MSGVRRRQYLREAQGIAALPDTLRASLVTAESELTSLVNDGADATHAAAYIGGMQTVTRALHELLTEAASPTARPELQLKCVSTMTEALRGAALGRRQHGPGTMCETNSLETRFMTALLQHFVYPFLLESDVRHLHRGIATLFRTCYDVTDVAVTQGLVATFSARLRAYTLCDAASVMHFLNDVDGLSSTLMPLLPDALNMTFVDILPLFGDSLQFIVSRTIAHAPISTISSLQTEAQDVSGEDVQTGTDGETECIAPYAIDLDHARFATRVVATYVHQSMNALRTGLLTDTAATQPRLTRLLVPAFQILCSRAFTKDILNATGLLVASMLTVVRCDGVLIDTVCRLLNAEQANSPSVPLTSDDAATAVAALVQLLLMHNPGAHLRQSLRNNNIAAASAASLLQRLFASVTDNGRFALYKGLLAHLSSPLAPNETTTESMGLLLVPLPCVDGEVLEPTLYNVIAPAVWAHCGQLQEPETRFLAIQTADSMVRYIAACVSYAAERVQRDGSSITIATLPVYCRPSMAMQDVLARVTQLIMGLWDDGTQAVSGPLYNTYNEILKINETLRRCWSAYGDAAPTQPLIDTHRALLQMCAVPNERRGKYHALLGLLSVMPFDAFVAALGEFYSVSSPVAALRAFSEMLLSGASNHKVGNIAGDVFALVAQRLRSAPLSCLPVKVHGSPDAFSSVVRDGLIAPLAEAIAWTSCAGAGSGNVTAATHVSNVTAHFVVPLLKQDKEGALMQVLLDALLALVDTTTVRLTDDDVSRTARRARVEQGVVEVLARARSVGLELTPHLVTGGCVFDLVQSAMQALEYSVRHTAFTMMVLGPRRLVPVTAWECVVVERYLGLNMHLGGDSTAQKALLEAYRKWTRRLADSLASVTNGRDGTTTKKQRRMEQKAADGHALPDTMPQNANNGTAASLKPTAYAELVQTHCVRSAQLFATHLGASSAARRGLAVERRVTAAACYTILLRTMLPSFIAGQSQSENNVVLRLFVPSAAVALVADLCDGWSAARAGAKELLGLFAQHVPALVCEALQRDGIGGDNDNAVSQAHTFRRAEGGVARAMLWRMVCHMAADAHHMPSAMDELRATCAELEARCVAIEALRGKAVYVYLQDHPLHGLLSFATALYRDVEQHAGKHHTDTGVTQDATVTTAMEMLLSCSCRVIRCCGLFIGTESTLRAEGGGAERVDCRGHVYDSSDAAHEATMRAVVNVTWLAMRTATAAVQRVFADCRTPTTNNSNKNNEGGMTGGARDHVTRLSLSTVRVVCDDLVHALLVTKHNGVMHCVRTALRTVAETLMRSHSETFHALPRETLRRLLGADGVTSCDAARMLRRSQGLPHAILAILEAEDAALPPRLLPHAVHHLLAIAQGHGEDDQGVSQRANALNVLKFIFEDKRFAERVVAFMEDAFMLATDGFTHASWNVRNSALMLFSAVLQRFVGEHPLKGGAGTNTSLDDLCRRTPRGVDFALRTLQRCNARESQCTSVDTDAANLCVPDAKDANLAVFPILQMLSMLSPDPAHLSGPAEPVESMTTRMAEAVWRCATSRHLLLRKASATALPCLAAATSDLPRFVQRTAQQLRVLHTGPNAHADLNAVHGALLQLQECCRVCCPALTAARGLRVIRLAVHGDTAMRVLLPMVLHALCGAGATLVPACRRCPTVAAAFFALSADVFFVCHQLRSTEITALAEDELAGLMCSVAERCIVGDGSRHDASGCEGGALSHVRHLPSRHALRESVALCFVTLLLPCLSSHAAVTESVRACMQRVMRAELQALQGDAAGAEPNVVTYMLQHALTLQASEACRETGGAPVTRIVALLDAWCECSVTALSTQMLLRRLLRSSSPATLHCTDDTVATHLSVLTACLTAGQADVPQTASQLPDALLAGLQTTLQESSDGCSGVAASTASPSLVTLLRNSEVQSAALQFVARHYVLYRGAKDAEEEYATRLTQVLAQCAAPHRSLRIRHAVLAALQTLLLSSSHTREADGVHAVAVSPRMQSRLLLLLLRLLFDDAHAVRQEACVVCSRYIYSQGNDALTTAASPRHQMTCVLSLMLTLRGFVGCGALDERSCRDLLALSDTLVDQQDAAAPGTEEADEDEDGSSESAAEEVLFEREEDNMFVEETVLRYIVDWLHTASDTRNKDASSFVTYDELLHIAMQRHHTCPRIGDL